MTKPRGVSARQARPSRHVHRRQAGTRLETAQAVINMAALEAAARAHEEVIELRAKLNMTREELRAGLAPPAPPEAGTDEVLRLKLALAEALELRFVNLPVEQRDIIDRLLEVREELQEARRQADHAQREYALIRASTSWRITAPLRRLVDAFRALRARPWRGACAADRFCPCIRASRSLRW